MLLWINVNTYTFSLPPLLQIHSRKTSHIKLAVLWSALKKISLSIICEHLLGHKLSFYSMIKITAWLSIPLNITGAYCVHSPGRAPCREGCGEPFLSARQGLTILQRKSDHFREMGSAEIQDSCWACRSRARREKAFPKEGAGNISCRRSLAQGLGLNMWRSSGWQEECKLQQRANPHIFRKMTQPYDMLSVLLWKLVKEVGFLHQSWWAQTCYPTQKMGNVYSGVISVTLCKSCDTKC